MAVRACRIAKSDTFNVRVLSSQIRFDSVCAIYGSHLYSVLMANVQKPVFLNIASDMGWYSLVSFVFKRLTRELAMHRKAVPK